MSDREANRINRNILECDIFSTKSKRTTRTFEIQIDWLNLWCVQQEFVCAFFLVRIISNEIQK